MKINILILILILFCQVNPLLPDKKRKELFLKYIEEIPNDRIEPINYFASNYDDFDDYELESIPYDKKEIDNIISRYNFPASYNFSEAVKAKVNVKDQGHCRCCWAFASTTTLSYRYKLIGKEVDLSPQHELSCYHSTCDFGISSMDSQLNLIKNGTVTEECLPYSSENHTVEPCPATCKDPNVEYKKYYAKNLFRVKIDQNNFYDVTAFIMDQLLTQGPVITSMTVFRDFFKFVHDPNCKNMVYTYDGVSEEVGRHALSLIGYGLLNDKYYWILQNSWGYDTCQGGFVKIEFGQVGVGNIAFSDPYIEEQPTPNVIDVDFSNMNTGCQLEVKSNSDLNNMKSQLNIIFKHEIKDTEFDYICGITKFINEEKKIKCYFELLNSQTAYKGKYTYKSFENIREGKGNTFKLNSFTEKSFTYYGRDHFEPLSKILNIKDKENNYYFVSKKGSRISFIFNPAGVDKSLPPIYANNKNSNALSNCKVSSVYLNEEQTQYIAYCDISDKELNYFDDYSKNENKMLYNVLCGQSSTMNLSVYKLDTKLYPSIYVKYFLISEIDWSPYNTVSLLTNIDGSVEGCKDDEVLFTVVVKVEKDNKNYTEGIQCSLGKLKDTGKNFLIYCQFNRTVDFDNLYLTPYASIAKFTFPYEIIIDKEFKGSYFIPKEVVSNYCPRYSSNFYIFIIFIFFIIF